MTSTGLVALDVASPAGRAAAEAVPIIEMHHVSVFYRTFEAVHDVTLPIYQHRITAMIGASGCRKSTALRSLTVSTS